MILLHHEVITMNISLETLIPIEKLQQEPNEVFKVVEKYGKAVLLKDNAPLYIIMKAQQAVEVEKQKKAFCEEDIKPLIGTPSATVITLHEAMRIVLNETEGHQMHASKLADAIYEQGLYVQKNGEKAKYNQIRARSGHYPEMFEALQGNVIRLRTESD